MIIHALKGVEYIMTRLRALKPSVNLNSSVIIVMCLIESIILSLSIFGVNEIIIDTDFNFPLNKEGAIRWITNNLDGYTFDIRGINRLFIGVIMYGLYLFLDYFIVIKIMQIMILFFSLLSTYYLLTSIHNMFFKNNTSMQILYTFLIAQLIIFNNFTISSRFATLSNLIFSYVYVPTALYFILRYVESKKLKYIVLTNIITLILPISQPVYFVIYFIFINFYILIFIKNKGFWEKIYELLKINLSFVSLFIVISLYLLNVVNLTEPYISTSLEELDRNTPLPLQFFTGHEYPLRDFQYCVNDKCYWVNYASEYYKSYMFLDYLYMTKYVIIAVSVLYFKKSELLYISFLYIVLISLVINAEIFKLSPEVALALRIPFYRFAFPIVIVEMTILLIALRTKLKIFVFCYLIILLSIYYFPLYSGYIYQNSPLFNFRLTPHELSTLDADINLVNSLEGPIIYLPYSNTSYSVCFSMVNKTIYYFINPFYLFSNKNIFYNSRYFELYINNKSNIIYSFGSINIVIEKFPCLSISHMSKFDVRQMISIDRLIPPQCLVTIYNLTNYIVYHVKCA